MLGTEKMVYAKKLCLARKTMKPQVFTVPSVMNQSKQSFFPPTEAVESST